MAKHVRSPWKLNPTVRRPRSNLDKELDRNPNGSWVQIRTDDICDRRTGTPICKVYEKGFTSLIENAPMLLDVLRELARRPSDYLTDEDWELICAALEAAEEGQ